MLVVKKRGVARTNSTFVDLSCSSAQGTWPQCCSYTLGFIIYTILNCANIQIFRCILQPFFLFGFAFWFYVLFFSRTVISKEPQTSLSAEWRDATLHNSAWTDQAETGRPGVT